MKKVWIALGVLAVVAAAWFLIGNRKSEANSYRFVAVERGTVEQTVSSTGTLRATSTVQVGTQVSGRIEAIYVDFNDHVKKGELIATIDPTLLQQEVRSAKASVERAKAELDQARREWERNERLYEDKVVTESEYTTAQYQMSVAKTAYESAQINLDKAERNLGYTEIRAPVDGTVLERNVDVGQTVAASLQAPQLFLIAGDLSQMEILALVDESDIGQIEPGQEVRFTVQAYPNRTFGGTVKQVRLQSTTQENVVNYYVAISVSNEDGTLLPGMTATVEFIVKRAENVFKVSNAALRFQPTEAMREEVQARRRSERKEGAGGSDSTRALDRARRGGAGGEGPGAFGGDAGSGNGARHWGGRNGGASRSDRGILWTLDKDGKLDIVPVKVGITDGQYTEITGPKVTDGLQAIAAVTSSVSEGATNPFEGQNQRGPGRHRPGF